MAEMWVDPGRLDEAARTVSAIGDVIVAAKPDVDGGLWGSQVGSACTAGSRAAAEALAVVADQLHSWSGNAAQAAAEYARSDAATADALGAVGGR
ncbi:hypothetical protein [Rhodococcus sp. ACT016]|uniref:hypothetical protein n=1 Tax=Rhodococcus sp. ACT016 TaxID=3134808 RepID=UPI003D28AC7A